MQIWTIGHSTRSFEDFLSLLKHHKIKNLVDVRSYPRSKRVPHYNLENLEVLLPKAGITYFWLGKTLGGLREEEYIKYMKSQSFREGVKNLLTIAERGNTVIMCAERNWQKCHRQWIAEELTLAGHEIYHIIDETTPYLHEFRT